ncbi:PucR family transcriptional regulator [Slackia heliotrinireducens]|nr:helix-turn-helix domain-containing protein [Slackia heliotrinireducens]
MSEVVEVEGGDRLTRVLPLPSDGRAQGGAVCVCPGDQEATAFSAVSGIAYVFVRKRPVQMPKGCSYAVVGADASCSDVLQEIADLFFRLNAWEIDVSSMLLEGQSLQDVFDKTQKLLGNPVYFHDAYYNILAFSEGDQDDSIKNVYEFLRRGKMGASEIDELASSEGYKLTFDSHGIQYMKKTGVFPDIYDYLYMNVRYHNRIVGRLIVDGASRTLTYVDRAVAGRLGQFVEAFYKGQYRGRGSSPDALIVNILGLLEGRNVDSGAVEKRLRDRGWDFKRHMICLVIEFGSNDRFQQLGGTVEGILEGLYDRAFSLHYDGRLVVVVNCDEGCFEGGSFDGRLLKQVKGFNFNMGICMPFFQLYSLRSCYEQALFALERGKAAGCGVACFKDYVLEYMMSAITDKCSLRTICPPGLAKLAEHDAFSKTDYVGTLKVYLENDCSPSRSCKALFVHRSTFQYRIDKINEITKAEYEDPKTKVAYLMALNIMDQDSIV